MKDLFRGGHFVLKFNTINNEKNYCLHGIMWRSTFFLHDYYSSFNIQIFETIYI